MWTWMMYSGAAAWILFFITVYGFGMLHFLGSWFGMTMLVFVTGFTLLLHIASAPQPNIAMFLIAIIAVLVGYGSKA